MQPQSYGTTSSIRVCQPGFDVRNCPDWAYLFNSGWPSLAIAFERTIDNPSGGPVTINHNLGFPPLAMVWTYINGIGSYGRQAAGFSVSSSQVTINSVNSSTKLTVRCFNVDISKEQLYPLPQGANAKLPYNDQFGIKQIKQGRNIQSHDLNDFIIHSKAQSPAVLAVATEKGKYFTNTNPGSAYAGPYIVFPLKTSYVPWAYCAVSNGGGIYSFQTINGLQLLNSQLVYALTGSTIGSIIVLRDPLFYPNVVSVIY